MIKKPKRSDIKYHLTIHVLTKINLKCASFIDMNLVIQFFIYFCSYFISLQFND